VLPIICCRWNTTHVFLSGWLVDVVYVAHGRSGPQTREVNSGYVVTHRCHIAFKTNCVLKTKCARLQVRKDGGKWRNPGLWAELNHC
jgi:hypothetical protein